MKDRGETASTEGKREIRTSIGICVFFIFACIVASMSGRHNRVYAPFTVKEYLPDSRSALAVWRSREVRGRTLLLFDSKLNADSSRETAVTDENYVDAAITTNIVRKVIHVVPKERWKEASAYLESTGLAAYSNGRFLTTIDGAPLEVTTLAGFTPTGEKPLLHINWGFFKPEEAEAIAALIASRKIDADIITMTGGQAPPGFPDEGHGGGKE